MRRLWTLDLGLWTGHSHCSRAPPPALWNKSCLCLPIMPENRRESRWWLEVGTEVCPACNHTYAYQTEHYCVDCDGPVCAVCIEIIEREPVCSSCFHARSSAE